MENKFYPLDTNGITPPNHNTEEDSYSYSRTNVWNTGRFIEQDNSEFELLEKELREIKQLLSEIKNSLGGK